MPFKWEVSIHKTYNELLEYHLCEYGVQIAKTTFKLIRVSLINTVKQDRVENRDRR